jgi:hypothetical protein
VARKSERARKVISLFIRRELVRDFKKEGVVAELGLQSEQTVLDGLGLKSKLRK